MVTHDPLGTVYKLHAGDDPLGLLGITLRPSIQTNAGRMSATVIVSTQDEDRSGDVVVTRGIRLDGHRKNPVCLLNHKPELLVGRSVDRLGTYTVKTHGEGRLRGEIFFHQGTQLGEDTFRAVEGNVLRGVSIGFQPIHGKVETKQLRGKIYHETDLIEVSVVPIPDNENTVIEAVHKTFGGKPPCPELAPYIPHLDYRPKFLTGGWEGKRMSTYKTAEPKEAVAQSRSGTFYKCPHCDGEMSHKNIYEDKDGKCRHGECHGHVILKDEGGAGPNAQAYAPVGVGGVYPKSLARRISGRLGQLRKKAMSNDYDDFGPTAADDHSEDEFLPDDSIADGAEEEMGGGPHDDHKAVVDDAVGNVLASIYDKFTSGQIDLKQAIKLFKECLGHHGKVASLEGEGYDEEGGELADDESDGVDDGFDEDGEDGEEEHGGEEKPDLEDKEKKKAEKACLEIWDKNYSRTMEGVYEGLGFIANEPADLDSQRTKSYARKLQRHMLRLEPINKAVSEGVIVTKGKKDDGPTDEEFEAYFLNGDAPAR